MLTGAKSIVGKASMILAFVAEISMAGSIKGTDELANSLSVKKQEIKNNYIKVTTGVTDFKHLHEKDGYVDIKYTNLKRNGLNLFGLDVANAISVRVGKHYKDFAVINFPDLDLPFVFDTTVGYMQVDSVKQKTIYNEVIGYKGTTKSEVQKNTAYIGIGAYADFPILSYLVQDAVFASTVTYKIGLNRKNIRGGLEAGARISIRHFAIGVEYKKFDLRGAKDAEMVNYKISYTFKF